MNNDIDETIMLQFKLWYNKQIGIEYLTNPYYQCPHEPWEIAAFKAGFDAAMEQKKNQFLFNIERK